MRDNDGKSIPKYMQIHQKLKLEIYTHKYDEPGSFPAENVLMEENGASRTTVRKALELLKEEGLIRATPGHGTDILDNFVDVHENYGKATQLTSIVGVTFDFVPKVENITHSDTLVDTIPCGPEAAEALEVDEGTNIYRIRWLHMINNVPYLYLTNYLRMDMAPALPDKVKNLISLYPVLEKEYGLKVTRGEETITPTAADFISARLLDVEAGTPLTLLRRRAYCEKGPLEYSKSLIRPDLMQIKLVMA